ncbi:hypothetical protein [Pelosinus propionicus]|uniref:Uncharacterized protein n=1 Tax=Pelosinus propionicus DSM 13327 TaxID=1123291 RepID=A0A1I4QF37_9FIRM|nr:hypothetical protein [Pelosinus propionicus]SFM38345.1 hypothetical protein SAMN04490355_10968 [Pelosinus propionicus DSM 13327]
MVNDYEPSQYLRDNNQDYYTAEQAAQIEGVRKEAILKRCRLGKYSGAFKKAPTPENPQGMWYIPKSVVGPSIIKDVAEIPRQITPTELTQAITEGIQTVVTQAINQAVTPLYDEMRQMEERQREEIAKNQETNRLQQLAINRENQKRHDEMLDKMLRQSQNIQQMKIRLEKPWWKFWE